MAIGFHKNWLIRNSGQEFADRANAMHLYLDWFLPFLMFSCTSLLMMSGRMEVAFLMGKPPAHRMPRRFFFVTPSELCFQVLLSYNWISNLIIADPFSKAKWFVFFCPSPTWQSTNPELELWWFIFFSGEERMRVGAQSCMNSLFYLLHNCRSTGWNFGLGFRDWMPP